MQRSVLLIPALALGLAACDSAPALGPLDGPQLLIGQSPLIRFDPADPAGAVIEVTTEVTRGLTEPAAADRFLLRVSASFRTSGDGDIAGIAPKDVGVSQPKDEGLRGKGTVSIVICINVPAPVLAALEAADAADGAGNPSAAVTVQLVLVDGRGQEHVLDTRAATGVVDANGDG